MENTSSRPSISTPPTLICSHESMDVEQNLMMKPIGAKQLAEEMPTKYMKWKPTKAEPCRVTSTPRDDLSVEDCSPSNAEARSSKPRIEVHNMYGGNTGIGTLSQQFNYYQTNVSCYSNLEVMFKLTANLRPTGGKTEQTHDITKSEERQLEGVLTKRAKEICGEMQLPIQLNLPIRTEKLELVKGVDGSVPNLDFEGHYSSRKDVVKILSRTSEGNLDLKELFSRSLEEAQREAKLTTNNEEAFNKHVRRHGNIVAVIGQAGIGKTTLARKMVQIILEGKVLPTIPYIFYIPFREVDFSSNTTLFRFMMTGCRWKHSSISDEAWLDKLEGDPNVVFIFDGLDEANTNLLYGGKSRRFIGSDSNPVAFIRNIFSGQIFASSKKLITSRPQQFFDLNSVLRPHFAVNILGLSPKSQDKLGKQICVNNFDVVRNFLYDNPDIASLLYVPVKSIITFAILSISLEESGSISILSSTDLFVQALLHFIASDHLREKGDEVWKLVVFAWNKFLLRKIIFLQDDFKKADIDTDTYQAFLVTTTKANIRFSILSGHKLISFTHLIWHELFTAMNAIFLLSVNEFKSHVDKLTDPLWEIVAKFMFGLCQPSVNTKVKCIFPKDEDLSEKKKILFGLALRAAEEECSKLCGDGFYELSSSFLQICGWIYEAGNSELKFQAASYLPDKMRLDGRVTMLPSDVLSFLNLLQHTKNPIVIDEVYHNLYAQDGLQRFLQGIVASPVTIGRLHFENVSVDEDLLSSLVDALGRVRKLEFAMCDLNSADVIEMARKLATLPQPMEELQIEYNYFDEEAVMSLADAVRNVRRLSLSSTRLRSAAVIALLEEVEALSQPMEFMDLCGNNMNANEVVASLVAALHNVKGINLRNCNLSEHDLKAILEKVASLPDPKPEVLGLENQDFSDDDPSGSSDDFFSTSSDDDLSISTGDDSP